MEEPVRKKIHEVFTPRDSIVNTDMYISRRELEEELYTAIAGSMHLFLLGESGNGKSWLYKKLFSDKGVFYVVANCANVDRIGSVTEVIFAQCFDVGTTKKISYSESKKAGLELGATAEISHTGNYDILQDDKLYSAFEKLRHLAGNNPAVIVMDNVENLLNSEKLIRELGNIILLLDDEKYGRFDVKILLVGTPNSVLSFYPMTGNEVPISNRVNELSRVMGFSREQVIELVRIGFGVHLKAFVNEETLVSIGEVVFERTLGIPQRVHEYCKCYAYEMERFGWEHNESIEDEATSNWLRESLRAVYSKVDRCLQEGSSDNHDKRIELIYAIGKIQGHYIDSETLLDMICEEFPNDDRHTKRSIGQMLSALSKGDNCILTKASQSNNFQFLDPKILMCIKVILVKEVESQRVRVRRFSIT